MSDVRYTVGLLVRGVLNPEAPTNTNPALFTANQVASISGATGNLATAQFVGRIPRRKDAVDGYTSSVNLREPFSAGGNLKVKLSDKVPDQPTQKDFCQLFAADLPFASSSSWSLCSNIAYLPKGTGSPPSSTFKLRGPTIAVGDILFVENEALKVTARTNPATNIWNVTVQRGVLGTRNQEHTINPNYIPPGDDGSKTSIVFTNRPDFDAYSFETELHHFSLDGQVATKIDSYYRLTDGRPVADGDEWAVQTKDFAKVLMDWEAKREGVVLSHSLEVIEESTSDSGGYYNTGPTIRPPHIKAYLTTQQAERLFNRRLRAVESNVLLEAEVAALATRYFYSTKLRTEFLIEAGGFKWVYKLDNVSYQASPIYASELDINYVVLSLSFVHCDENANVRNAPKGYPLRPVNTEILSEQEGVLLDVGDVVAIRERPAQYNDGFTPWEADVVRVEDGETPPKLSMRIWLSGMRPIERLLTLCISRHGGGQSHAVYDIIPGEVCPGIDSAFFNLTVGLSDPLAIDTATHKLLEIDALLTTQETVPIDLLEGFKFGTEINRTCRLFGLIRADVPDGLTLRLLERGITSVPTDINQVVGKGFLVNPGQRLPAEKALMIQGGYDPVTLKFRWQQPIYVLNGTAKDLANAAVIRLWQQGNSQSLEQIFAGPIGKLMQLALLSAKGSPATFRVTTHRPYGARYAGDLVFWSDSSIPTPLGRGITNLRMKIIGRDVEFFTGDQHVLLLPDNLNTLTASEGNLAPALKIVASAVDNKTAHCFVELLGAEEDGSFDITTTLAIYQTLAGENAIVRIVNEAGQNPSSERPGWLEADGVVDAIGYDAAGRNLMILTLDAGWVRDGYTYEEIVQPNTSYILLSDYQNESNPTGSIRVPHTEQGPIGEDYAWVGVGDGLPPANTPFFGNLTKIQDA